MNRHFQLIVNNWRSAVAGKVFRLCLIYGLMVSAVIVVFQPTYYRFIEARTGAVLNDFILENLVPFNVSLPIFILIWGMIAIGIIRCLFTPHIFLNYMMGFIFITFFRTICLYLVPLDPPVGIIVLKDPFLDVFYGGSFITKDLFFSGHTATLVLLFLALEKKSDKYLCIISAVFVGILLLVQHVHYSMDIIAAPFFAWAGYISGQKILSYLRFRHEQALVSAPVK